MNDTAIINAVMYSAGKRSHSSPSQSGFSVWFCLRERKPDIKPDCSGEVCRSNLPPGRLAHARQLTSVARRRRDLAPTSSDHNHLNSAVTLSQVYGVCILSLM